LIRSRSLRENAKYIPYEVINVIALTFISLRFKYNLQIFGFFQFSINLTKLLIESQPRLLRQGDIFSMMKNRAILKHRIKKDQSRTLYQVCHLYKQSTVHRVFFICPVIVEGWLA